MPARHDILCGALDFLWKPWGSIELWEQPITAALHEAGVVTQLVTDHPHLFETGGENYHTDFSGWDYVRGHEGDPWRTWPDPSWVGAPARPPARRLVLRADRIGFDGVDAGLRHRPARTSAPRTDYPGPQTMESRRRLAARGHPAPRTGGSSSSTSSTRTSPSTPPSRGRRCTRTGRTDGDAADLAAVRRRRRSCKGHLTEAEGRHIRANYGAKLSMIDHWFGRILDAFDEQDLWDDTALIVCTDHGHYLGDERDGRDIWGKPAVPQFEPLGHTPLLVAWPGVDGGGDDRRAHHQRRPPRHDRRRVRRDAVAPDPRPVAGAAARRHGDVDPRVGDRRRLRQLGPGHRRAPQVRPGAGGRRLPAVDVVEPVVDDAAAHRRPPGPARPRRSGLPRPHARLGRPGDPPAVRAGDLLPMWASGFRNAGDHHFYDLDVDPDEQENRVGEPVETEMIDLLRTALDEVEAPAEQYQRLGLA